MVNKQIIQTLKSEVLDLSMALRRLHQISHAVYYQNKPRILTKEWQEFQAALTQAESVMQSSKKVES